MASVVALNVVLLPDDQTQSQARTMNSILRRSCAGFPFDETHVPHITVLQMYVKLSDVPTLEKRIWDLVQSKRLHAIELEAIGVDTGPEFEPERHLPSIVYRKTEELMTLHEVVVEGVKDLICQSEPTPDNFWHPEGEDGRINQASMDWVTNFLSNSAYGKYFPHITLVRTKGVATLDSLPELKTFYDGPFYKFTATNLSIFFLGNFCTCRKLQKEFHLLK